MGVPHPIRFSRAVAAIACAAMLLVAAPGAPAAPAVPAAAAAPAAPRQWDLDWAEGAVFYEIFVRSFQDSDGDGIGDFRGLASRLDYLNDGNPATKDDLGVDALWLMPVFASPSYHGYDVTDYERVNPEYGSEADFDSLLAAAHRRGIRVIVDLVLNHTSSDHPWFQSASADTASRYRDWYVWNRTDPGWAQPWNAAGRSWHKAGDWHYYGLFWGGMPDLNFRNPEVRAEMERVAAYWLRRGVDGFRLDATRHLIETGPGPGQAGNPETHAALREFAAAVRRVKPDALLVGENWTDTADIADYFGATDSIARGDVLPSNFNFPLAAAIVEGVKSGDAGGIAAVLIEMARLYPRGVIDAPFLTNHDMQRLATQVGGRRHRMNLAAAILLTLPGAPFLYYGEEIGMENGPGHDDRQKRTPMAWTGGKGGGFTTGEPWFAFAPGRARANVEKERKDAASLLRRYQALIRVRRGSPALRQGAIQIPDTVRDPSSVLAYFREWGDDRVLVAHNLGGTTVEAGPFFVEADRLRPLFTDRGVGKPAASAHGTTMVLPAHATGVWAITGAPKTGTK
ncbi:MAG TPA: alpha-amylase family glycosyl hydrolase [Candidatus Eisenbacteria bacterium]|nr:alpha-amylase family glycosyl hydrolase [Candidatus Eisenbacteria bacterium]